MVCGLLSVRAQHATHPPSPVVLCVLQVVAQSNTFILAGYETTANTLSFAIYNIARDPEVERRLLLEVDAFGRDKRVTYADLDKVCCRQQL